MHDNVTTRSARKCYTNSTRTMACTPTPGITQKGKTLDPLASLWYISGFTWTHFHCLINRRSYEKL